MWRLEEKKKSRSKVRQEMARTEFPKKEEVKSSVVLNYPKRLPVISQRGSLVDFQRALSVGRIKRAPSGGEK